MSRNRASNCIYRSIPDVTSREGRVSRNLLQRRKSLPSAVTSREGRVSRNHISVHLNASADVTSREGRVSRNDPTVKAKGPEVLSRPARGV